MTSPSLVDLIKSPPDTPGRTDRLCELAVSHYAIIAGAVREGLEPNAQRDHTHQFILLHYLDPEDDLLRRYDVERRNAPKGRYLLRNWVFQCARNSERWNQSKAKREEAKLRASQQMLQGVAQKANEILVNLAPSELQNSSDPDLLQWDWDVASAAQRLRQKYSEDGDLFLHYWKGEWTLEEARDRWLAGQKHSASAPDSESKRFTDRSNYLKQQWKAAFRAVLVERCITPSEAEEEYQGYARRHGRRQ